VTSAAGNVSLEQSLTNTRFVLDVVGAGSVPLFAGAALRSDGLRFEQRSVHGPDGLAGLSGAVVCGQVEAPTAVAPDATLVCLAPMTTLLDMRGGEVVATFAKPGEANHAMDPQAAKTIRSGWLVHDVAPTASLCGWQPVVGADRIAGLVDALVAHQRRRGAVLGDAEALFALLSSRDPVGDLAGLLGR
jgi:inosine-uridine nucleoside N-ribohydrolase